MIVTTTPAVEGRKIVAYKGTVFGEVVSGVNFIKDMFSSITDMIGGRSGTYEKELQEAREKALAEMFERAAKLGADAVVGNSNSSQPCCKRRCNDFRRSPGTVRSGTMDMQINLHPSAPPSCSGRSCILPSGSPVPAVSDKNVCQINSSK